MKFKEKRSNHPLACFKIEDLKFFHTGDIKSCVIPDNSVEFNPHTYARIRFHISADNKQKTESSILIPYTQPITYEFMESFALSKLTDMSYSVNSNLFHSVRFDKMELEQTDGTNELVYYLIFQPPPLKLQKTHSGLVIGRFQPLHLGHVYLFKKVLELVDCLKIGVGSSQMHNQPKNPFTFEERKKFIEDALLDEKIPLSRFEVYAIPDLFNFEKWMNSILEIVEEFEMIFTNNLWIGRLLQNRGKILKYGLKYEITKYNGTRIRNLIRSRKSEWKSLVPDSIIPFLESWALNQ